MLTHDQIHVWRAELEHDRAVLAQLAQSLDRDETRRAERFYFEIDRRRFVAAHGILREVLALYTMRAPSEIRFTYGEFGKPALALDVGSDAIRFNLSHSGSRALIAVALDRDVGVDLEVIGERIEPMEIARSYFSREEINRLHSLPERLRRAGFFNCWTRKEAYIKARAMGMSLALDSFDVSLAPGEPAALLRTTPPGDREQWMLRDLEAGPGYAAALAARGSGWTVLAREWEPSLRAHFALAPPPAV
jgi:4'-phosphopantetheinyl transferase